MDAACSYHRSRSVRCGGSMDGRCTIYHGDAHIVVRLELPRDGRLWDFGYGFYGTESLRQAKRWALTRRQVFRCDLYRKQRPGCPELP
ncbi:DUF3990 domain-containing protein [Olsenella sp. AGMB03486]|uniref:DUF3990 domain-containing protein n=1 Tax=Olsenella sp. AGMB03486 TaxID=3230364 RepID=UPI0034A06B4B